ncbi:MAG TPA: hypothetical protein PL033_05585 [Candidatus Brocadiia bacterium]|nr:hypothetical protein [Candidatus Brocadiia bacterium]
MSDIKQNNYDLEPSLRWGDGHNGSMTGASVERAFTARSVGLGLTAVVFLTIIHYISTCVMQNSPIVGTQLGPAVILFMIALAMFNVIAGLVMPSARLNPGETLVCVAIFWSGCGIGGWATVQVLLPCLITPVYAAAHMEPVWGEPLKNIPEWMLPTKEFESRVVSDFMAGAQSEWWWPWTHPDVWMAWIGPLVKWGIAFAAFYGLLMCVGSLVMRQWAVSEHLQFPVAQIPLAILEEPGKGSRWNETFRSRHFRLAAATVFGIGILEGLNAYYPQVPKFPREWHLNGVQVTYPLSFCTSLIFHNYFVYSIFGITLFLSLDISFSIWICVFLIQIFRIVMGVSGLPLTEGETWAVPYAGYVVYCVAFLWIGRSYYIRIFKLAAKFGKLVGELRDLARERRLARAAAVCAIILFAWLLAAGLPLWYAALLMFAMVFIMLSLTRMMAEAGLIYLQADFRPAGYLPELLGPGALSRQSLAASAAVAPLLIEERDSAPMMAHSSMRINMGDDGRARSGLLSAMCISMIVAYVVACAVGLLVTYRYGIGALGDWPPVAERAVGGEALNAWRSTNQLRFMIGNIIAGLSVAFLAFMRLHFPWWPLHPVGLLVAASWPGLRMWASVMAGWFFKWACVRYGGTRMTRVARMIGLGVIVGEAAAMMLWVAVGAIVWTMGYQPQPVRFSCSN